MHPATTFERILVGVDAQGLAAHAAARGGSLARHLGSRVELLHAVQVPPLMWPGVRDVDFAEARAEALANAREALLSVLGEALPEAREAGTLQDVLSVREGHPAKVLLDRAEELRADLIVLGGHTRRSMFDFGSTARALLARARCPVWTQVERVGPIERVAVAVDFSEDSREALRAAHALALRLGASVRLLHSYAPPVFAYANTAEAFPGPIYAIEEERKAAQAELARWHDDFEWGPVPAEATFLEGEPTSRLLEEARGDDLLVLGTHGRTGLARFLLGSVAYGVLKAAHMPVLVVPAAARDWLLPGARPG